MIPRTQNFWSPLKFFSFSLFFLRDGSNTLVRMYSTGAPPCHPYMGATYSRFSLFPTCIYPYRLAVGGWPPPPPLDRVERKESQILHPMFLVVGKNKSPTREIRTRDDDPQDSPLTIYKHSRAQLCVCVCVQGILNFILFSLALSSPSLLLDLFWLVTSQEDKNEKKERNSRGRMI